MFPRDRSGCKVLDTISSIRFLSWYDSYDLFLAGWQGRDPSNTGRSKLRVSLPDWLHIDNPHTCHITILQLRQVFTCSYFHTLELCLSPKDLPDLPDMSSEDWCSVVGVFRSLTIFILFLPSSDNHEYGVVERSINYLRPILHTMTVPHVHLTNRTGVSSVVVPHLSLLDIENLHTEAIHGLRDDLNECFKSRITLRQLHSSTFKLTVNDRSWRQPNLNSAQA